MPIDAVVFDFGGVLVEWNPRHLYRKLFVVKEQMERFLTTVCTLEWNGLQDGGRPIATAVAELSAAYPEEAGLIAAYYERWDEMIPGAIDETVAVLGEVRAAGVPCYLLSNVSAEMYPRAARRFGFLRDLDGVLLSGDAGTVKPSPGIFATLCDRFGLVPERTFFVDDLEPNVAAARELGFYAVVFTGAAALRAELSRAGVLPGAGTAAARSSTGHGTEQDR